MLIPVCPAPCVTIFIISNHQFSLIRAMFLFSDNIFHVLRALHVNRYVTVNSLGSKVNFLLKCGILAIASSTISLTKHSGPFEIFLLINQINQRLPANVPNTLGN